MKKFVLFALVLSILCAFYGCTNKTEETTTVTTAENTTEKITEASTDFQPLASFKPFECSGENFSTNTIQIPVSETGIEFSATGTDENSYAKRDTICYKLNGKEKILYKNNYDIDLCAYADSTLYFSASDDNRDESSLYRMKLYYDETGDIVNSELSLVCQEYSRLIRVMKNSLIVTDSFYNGKYAEIDTLTGKLTPIEYNFEASYSDYSNVAKISESQALEIAKNALKNPEYWESWDIQEEEGFPYFGELHSSKFMVNPYYSSSEEKEVIERFPDYAWYFDLGYEPYGRYTVYISVNAVTGNVCYYDIQLND